jgi:hypothetical protein
VPAYLAEGVRRLALAWSIRDRSQLDEVRQAVSVPMRVVRLDADAELMRRRLLADPTEERREDDLMVGLEWPCGRARRRPGGLARTWRPAGAGDQRGDLPMARVDLTGPVAPLQL